MACRLEPCSKAVLDAVSGDNSEAERVLTLPDSLITAMLEREQLLTKAKLHELNFQRVAMEIRVYHLRRLISLVSLPPCFALIPGRHCAVQWLFSHDVTDKLLVTV